MKKDYFYESNTWNHVRYLALRRDGFKCVCCGVSRDTGAILHVDHIKPRSKYPEHELSLNNLQTLCASCNLGKSNKFEDRFIPLSETRIKKPHKKRDELKRLKSVNYDLYLMSRRHAAASRFSNWLKIKLHTAEVKRDLSSLRRFSKAFLDLQISLCSRTDDYFKARML